VTDTFRQLCTEVYKATVYEPSYEKCCLHYKRVLDYIVAHPEEHNEIAAALERRVRAQCAMPGDPPDFDCQIYLVQFLMQALKWPEIKAAAEDGYNNGDGPGWIEVKHLLEVYN
jgi:hypothetical protein